LKKKGLEAVISTKYYIRKYILKNKIALKQIKQVNELT